MEKLTKALMTDETGQAIVTKLTALSGQMHELAMATRGAPILFDAESDISVLGDGGYLAVYVGSTNPLVISGWTGDNSLVTGNMYYLVKSGTAVTSMDMGEYGGTAVTDTTLAISGKPADAKAVGDALALKADADDLDAIDDRVTAVETAIVEKANKSYVNDILDNLYGGNVPLYGELVQGFYPLNDGTMGANSNARTMVFPVVNGKKYLISWLSGANKYRTAFGNTNASNISAGTEIYDYTDNNSTTHEDYSKMNGDGYKYLYVYIGNTSSATELSCAVKMVLNEFDSCFASDGDTW